MFWRNQHPLRQAEGDGGGDGGGGGGDGGGGGGGSGFSPDGVNTFSRQQYEAALSRAVEERVQSEVQGLKSKNEELLGKIQAHKPILEAIGDLGPEDVTEALSLARETREKKLRAEGDFDALKESHRVALERREQAFQEETEKLTTQYETVLDELHYAIAEQQATKALSELGGVTEVMLPHVMPHVKVVENEGPSERGKRFRAIVVDGQGNERYVDGQTPMTIKHLAEEFRNNETFGANFRAGEVTGSGAKTITHGGQVRAHRISHSDAQDVQKYRRAKEAAEKAGVPLEIGQAS